jgi:hypothetical protein
MPWSFMSAAISIEPGQTGAELEGLLQPAKVGKPLYRKQTHTQLRFWYSLPSQLDVWEVLPGGYASNLNVVFESATQDQARPLAEHTMDLFSNPPSGLHSVNLTLYQDYRLFLSRAFAPDGVQMGIASSTGFNGLPNDLLTPWLSAGESALTLKDGKTTKSNWSLSDVEAEFQSSERGELQLAAPVSEFERTLLAAIKKRLEAGIDYAYSYFLVAPGDFQTTAARLVNTLPGFVNTGIFAAYRKGFDPYARPADLDSGRSVRYPLFYADLRSGSILQVDCLHRPKRGSVLDIQVAHMTDKKKPVKDLQKLLEKIEAPHEIWAGSFLGRWE